jgi:hypothetical protein
VGEGGKGVVEGRELGVNRSVIHPQGVSHRRGVKLPKGRAAAKQLSYTMVRGAAKRVTHSYYHHVISHHHSLPCPPLSTSHLHSSCNVHVTLPAHTHTLPAKECVQRARSEQSVQCPTGSQAKSATPQDHVNHPTHQNIQRSRCYTSAEPTPHALCNIHKRRHHQHTTLFLLRSAGWSEHTSQLHYTRRNTTIQTTSSLYKRPLYKLSLSHH